MSAFLHTSSLLELSDVSFLCHRTSLLQRNFKKFFLQGMSDSNIKSRGRKATVILLDSDIAWLLVRASDLVLLLNHNRGETSTSGGMTENVSDIVVAKHQRWTVMTARRVISEHVHLRSADCAVVAERGTRKRCVEQGQA